MGGGGGTLSPQVVSQALQEETSSSRADCMPEKRKAEEMAESAEKKGVVVHYNADGTTHTHGPSNAKICGLGTVTLGGATFMIDRDGQVESGKVTEFGVGLVPGSKAVVPTAAWLANPDGSQVCDPIKGDGHDDHWHFNVEPFEPV